MQTGEAHDPVQQERSPRHVAHVFEQDDEQEQDHDLRQEDEDAADPCDHAVANQTFEEAIGQDHRRPSA